MNVAMIQYVARCGEHNGIGLTVPQAEDAYIRNGGSLSDLHRDGTMAKVTYMARDGGSLVVIDGIIAVTEKDGSTHSPIYVSLLTRRWVE